MSQILDELVPYPSMNLISTYMSPILPADTLFAETLSISEVMESMFTQKCYLSPIDPAKGKFVRNLHILRGVLYPGDS